MKIIESQELSQFSGIIKIDTTNNPITIFMKQSPEKDSVVKLVKISKDDNMITLFSDHSLVDGAEITGFGFLNKLGKKITSITLKSTDKNWTIIKEE